MQLNNEKKLINSLPAGETSGTIQISTADRNRFEALKILSQTILREVDILRLEENIATSPKINLAEEMQNYEADSICG